MADEKTGGNAADSPAADGSQADNGQAADAAGSADSVASGQSADDIKTDGVDGAASPGDADKGGDKDEGADKDPPYNEDPKWLSARAAEKRVNELLADNDYDSMDALVVDLQAGKSLKQLIGDSDAEQLVADSQELGRVKDYWAQKDAEKLEENEAEAETIARLKKENQELVNKFNRTAEDQAAITESQRVLSEFDSTVNRLVAAEPDLTDADKSMLNLFLGVGNPAAAVDPADGKAVREVAANGIKQFREFLQADRQATIDNYVAGKTDITPVKKSTGADTPNVKTEHESFPEGATMDDVNTQAKARLVEIFTKASA